MKNNLTSNDIIMSLSKALSLYYFFNSNTETSIAIAAKFCSTALLALHAHQTQKLNQDAHLKNALIAHCIGDLLIELPGAFIPSIFLFGIGHSFYIQKLKNNAIASHELTKNKSIMLGIISAYSAAFTYFLMTKTTGIIQVAIPIYSIILSSMFMLTCLQKEKPHCAFTAALLYVLSDNIIGINMFATKIPGSNYLSWMSYYCGQIKMMETLHIQMKR